MRDFKGKIANPETQHQPSAVSFLVGPRVPRLYWFIGLALAGLSSLTPLVLILVNGVNVPFWDEWSLTSLIEAVRTGHATVGTFWAPHNEHRILIPKVAFSLLIPATGWNSIAIMVFSWLIVTTAGLFLFYSLTTVFNPLRPRLWLATIGVVFLLFFSPTQKENWLWAFQLGFFLVHGAAIVSLLYVSFTDIALGKRLALSIAFAIVASLSSAQGLLVWPVLVAIVVIGDDANKDKMVGVIVLIAAMAAMYALYLHNYPKMPSNPNHLPLGDLLRKPQLPFLYFVGLLGAPLTSWVPHAQRVQLACWMGSILLLSFFWLCYNIFKNHKQGRAAGWIGLGCFALAFCTMNTYGRAGLGVDFGVLTGRYQTHTLLFVIAIVTLALFPFDNRTGSKTAFEWVGRTTLLLGIAVCIFLGYLSAFNEAAGERRPRLAASKLLPFFAYLDPRGDVLTRNPFWDVWYPPPTFDHIRPYIDLGFVRTVSGVPFKEGRYGLHGDSRFMRRQGSGSEELVFLTGRIRTPKQISPRLLFLRNKGQQAFIGTTELQSEKISELERSYEWQLAFATQLLGGAGEALEAWIYDQEEATFLKVQEIDAQGFGSQFLETLPGNLQNLAITEGGTCVIDRVNERVNGGKGFPADIPIKGVLEIEGWAAVSLEEGLAPDAIFLTLTDASGRIHYLESPLWKRPDVNAYFQKPGMGDTGFSFRGNLAAIHGEFRLKMILLRRNTIYRCDLGTNIVVQ